MEDEETGELFIPCRVCSQKCYKIHGKYHEKECFNGCASFFKVMLGDFAEKLRIPPLFVSQFITDQHQRMVLEGPSGQEWDVELLGTNNKLEFRHGWENFVNYHGLQLGDFVVFKYISESFFKVDIFGRSGCVKNTSALHLEKAIVGLDKRCPSTKMCSLNQPMSNKLLVDLVFDEKNNDEAEAVAENQRRKRKSFSVGHSSKNPGHCFSSQKDMTMKSATPFKSDTMKSAPPFKSDKPYRLMVMKSWNINKPNMLRFPKHCKNSLQLPRQKNEVILLDGECNEWEVRCIMKDNRPTLSAGWKYFTRDNNLKEGDICIFEQVNDDLNKFMFRVHIFPHVNKDLLQQDLEEG